ncbi:hypothetical protein A2U01_0085625, partial [Trifolium medium]|nr:hypothetical protein [Trifolium medium]
MKGKGQERGKPYDNRGRGNASGGRKLMLIRK